MNKQILRIGLVLAIGVVMVACATQPMPPADTSDVPGFWSGLLHGAIILPSFIVSLFTDHRIYAFPNSGRFYDLGFLLGAAGCLSGGAASAR